PESVLVNCFVGGLENPGLLTILNLEANSVCLVGLRVEDCDVGDTDRRLPLDDPAGLAGIGVRFGVTLNNVDSGDHDLVAAYQTGNGSTLALVLASDDDHFIVAFDLTHNPRPQFCL